jgi:hypothetical protein
MYGMDVQKLTDNTSDKPLLEEMLMYRLDIIRMGDKSLEERSTENIYTMSVYST